MNRSDSANNGAKRKAGRGAPAGFVML